MYKKILFILGMVLFVSLKITNLYAETIQIVPPQKPTLSSEEIIKKISKNIITPLKKPTKLKKVEKKVIVKEIKEKKLSFKIPKKKPSVAGVTTTKNIKKSKYYSKKDLGLAKKAISEMQKSKWTSALNISKKAKDKSIYNFIQWRHLLTTGNQASFYDYKVFIESNPEYPRIDRLKYLAEHKLSTANVSPKKIITWFGANEPLSGYGKMILGESHLLIGDKSMGTNLIKEGWITAKLSRNDLKFFR